MKQYQNPNLEILFVESTDVIATSLGVNQAGSEIPDLDYNEFN